METVQRSQLVDASWWRSRFEVKQISLLSGEKAKSPAPQLGEKTGECHVPGVTSV